MTKELYTYIILFFSAYLIGAVPWAFVLGKINGIDIRKHGSGNVGATNVRRTLGKKWGIACFFLDFLKGFLPVLAVKLMPEEVIPDTGIAIVTVSIGAVSGHMWPLFLKFKGGKGISTIGGILLGTAPLSLFAAGGLWALCFYTTRYVSLASIVAASFLPVAAFGFSYFKIDVVGNPELIMLTFLAALAILRHRGNIKRLLNGTESRFDKKKKVEEPAEETPKECVSNSMEKHENSLS